MEVDAESAIPVYRLSNEAAATRPDFSEVLFVGRRPPRCRVLLDLAFICDDGPVWVNRSIPALRSHLVRNIVATHGCCSGCASSSEVQIVLPGVISADLEKVFELIYMGYAFIDSLENMFAVKNILRMLAMEIVLELDQISMACVDVSEVVSQEDACREEVSDVLESPSSKRKRKRPEPSIIDRVKLSSPRTQRELDDNQNDSDDDADVSDERSDDDDEDYVIAIRDKAKGFKCQICDYSSSEAGNLKRHIKTVHDKIKDFKCKKCDFSSSQGSHLKAHIKAVHERIKDFKCKKCDFSSSRGSHLKRHLKAVHEKIKDFKCKKCDFSSSQGSHLKEHLKAVHDKIKDHA